MTYPVLVRIDRPYTDGFIEVFGEPDMAWYDYRIIDGNARVLFESDCQWGSVAICLRDALIADSGYRNASHDDHR
jgi:hypothetical protein